VAVVGYIKKPGVFLFNDPLSLEKLEKFCGSIYLPDLSKTGGSTLVLKVIEEEQIIIGEGSEHKLRNRDVIHRGPLPWLGGVPWPKEVKYVNLFGLYIGDPNGKFRPVAYQALNLQIDINHLMCAAVVGDVEFAGMFYFDEPTTLSNLLYSAGFNMNTFSSMKVSIADSSQNSFSTPLNNEMLIYDEDIIEVVSADEVNLIK
jgi:hypothetical protein